MKMNNYRIRESNPENVKAKIIDFKDPHSAYYPGLISVKRVELKAQNFKNKTIKQSYNIDFLPYLPYLYVNKTNIHTKRIGWQRFENSDLYYIYNREGDKNSGYGFRNIKKELLSFNKDLFKLRKSSRPLELLSELFESLDNKIPLPSLYSYYGSSISFDLTFCNFEKGYSVFLHLYLYQWKKIVRYAYKDTIINLEKLTKYSAFSLCKLQNVIDLSDLGYRIPYKNNPLENLYYYLKKESAYKTLFLLEQLKSQQQSNLLINLESVFNDKSFLKKYISEFEPNKSEGGHYSWQAEYNGFDYTNELHYLEKYYRIFDLKLYNKYGLSNFGQRRLYLQNYIYTEGPCLTASYELQKLKNSYLAGRLLKKNAFFFKLSFEQIALLGYSLSASID